MVSNFKSKGYKVLKWAGLSLGFILFLMYLLPVLFPGKITEEVKLFANKKLNSELNFKEVKLSFFNHFPSLTVSLTQFSLKGSAPFEKETLVSADEISFGINLSSLIFNSSISIDEIFVSEALFNVKVNAKGEPNYNVYNSDSKEPKTESQSSTDLRLEKIHIENSHLVYDDKSTKVLIDASGFNYDGRGDLDKAVFDLHTKAQIATFDLNYDGQQYLMNKNVNATLITKINTDKLSFIFEQNDLNINKLPINFKGKFDFLSDGYAMDFNITSNNSNLSDFFTALPPQYVTWLEKTKVEGNTDFGLTLKGNYNASKNQNPDLNFKMKITKGLIEYQGAPFPASNIFLNFQTQIPSLDPERLKVTIDSVFFNVGKDYVKAIVKTEGLTTPTIEAQISSRIDLEKMNKAFGLKNIDIKGILDMDIKSKGILNQKNNQIPVTAGKLTLKNGYIKTEYYPHPIKDINLVANIQDDNGTKDDLKVLISPASFLFEDRPVYIEADLQNFNNIRYDIKARGELDIAKIYKVFSQKGLDVEGFIKADISLKGSQQDAMKGRYANLKNSGTLYLRNIKTTSEYLPKPFIITEGTFSFNQDKMNFKNFLAAYGQSDFKMSGYLQNVIDFVLTDTAILKGNFDLKSKFINVDEFMLVTNGQPGNVLKETPNQSTGSQASTPTGVVVIPTNFNIQCNAFVQKLNFNDLLLEKLHGNMLIKQGQLQLKQSGFDIIGCQVNADLLYGNQNTEKAFFDLKIVANDFDIKRAYNEVKLFREMATAAQNAEGIVSLDYKVAGKLDKNMMPIYPSLNGGGTLSVKNVKMNGFKMFNAVSKKTGKDDLKNPDVTKVDIHSSIKNNIITIERFKFKVAGFRPKIEGQSSFDGKLNLKMRLGLPPLGIIGIPIKVTGTQENPIVKLGKQTEDLEETEYEDGQVPIAAPVTPITN